MVNVTLTVTGDPQVFTPGRRIFMFTYYPERQAVLPEFTEILVEGEAKTDDGVHRIRTNLVVTPDRIASSRDLIDRDPDEIVKQLHSRRDVRLPEAVIYIKYQNSCSRFPKKASGTADTEAPEDAVSSPDASEGIGRERSDSGPLAQGRGSKNEGLGSR